ncbi:DUF4013 domain-containing protein [Halorussus limi]|uniref:DUF4013 domain-containing protein n=2 Tax=Halorussus limi TaxID=2938695 RepID=A0A8U0HUE4_9EURY|nr:DUF4013 domain-containing protein [Halorussus limi]
MIRAMAAASREEAEPPAFEDWGELLVDGIKASAVGIAYALVPIILLFTTTGVLGAGSEAGGNAGGVLAGIGVLGLLVVVVLLFALQYALPAALTNMGREERLGAAFDFETLKPVLTSGEYLKAVILTFGVALIGGIAFSVFALVTIGIGYLVAPFFYFWLYLAGSYMFGTAFGSVVDTEPAGASQQVQMS